MIVKKQDLVIGERYFLDGTMDAEGTYIGVNGDREPLCTETSIGFNDIKYHKSSSLPYEELKGIIWFADIGPQERFYKQD